MGGDGPGASMSVTVTLVMRPTVGALGRDWPVTGWSRLVELAAKDGGRLPADRTQTAGLRLHRTDRGLRLAPVIASGGPRAQEDGRQIRRELRNGHSALWLSDPELRALDGFTLRDERAGADRHAPGRWRRCLPVAAMSKKVEALLPPVDADDPFWQQLDALHGGSFFRFDAKAEFVLDEEIIAIGDVEDEETAEAAGRPLAGWWNPIMLQFSPNDGAKGVVAALLDDPTALLDLQVALAGERAGAADRSLAARFWLHEALRGRADKAGVAGAPLPRLVFGPDARPEQALAFLLLDLAGGSFLLDVASGRGARPAAWLAPAEAAGTVADWLRATCRTRLDVEAADPGMTAPEPIEPGTPGTQPGAGKRRTGGGATARRGLAAMAEGLPASLLSLALALDHPRADAAPGAVVAAEAAELLREALAPGAAQAGGRVALIEDVARSLALPRSAILLRFPGPPDALGPAARAEWRAQAERYCISLAESAHAAGYWWLAGLGEASAAGNAEPPWSVHEVHWAARLYRAAFVQAAPSWRPNWYVAAAAGIGEALLGDMILGSMGVRTRIVPPGRTRIANVDWKIANVDRDVGRGERP